MSGSAVRVRAFVVLGLVSALLAVPTSVGASARAAVQGVTEDEIEIVILVPDIDALKAKGITTSRSTTASWVAKFGSYADAYGRINGRKIVLKPVGWDPIDVTSFDRACTQATQDNKPFLVLNGAGFRAASIPCISIDNKTPFFAGDMISAPVHEAAGKNLVSVSVPPEAAARTTAQILDRTKLLPKSAKIGILSNNEPSVKVAGDTLEAELKKRKFDVVAKIELNGLAADAGLLGRESAAAANTFTANGVDTVFNVNSFTTVGGFYQEVERGNVGFKLYAVDASASACTPSGVVRTPPVAAGTICVTAYDTRATPTKVGLKPDNAFEAECRKEFDAATGRESDLGAPSGDLTVNGVTYAEDFPAMECTMASVLLPAIEKAGKNLNWNKVHANLMNTRKTPTAYMSNGTGGYAKNKPYLPNLMHVVTLNAASSSTPPDANGLFNGCPIPANCWVPMEVDGREWFPVAGDKG